MPCIYRDMQRGEEQGIIALVRRVFEACVAPAFAPQGVAEFYRFLEALPRRLADGVSFVLLALEEERPVGMIEMRDGEHIALFFVDMSHQRRGIGRALLAQAIARALCAHPALPTISVHASPNAVPAYERMGFHATGDERQMNGIRFVPMIRPLALHIRPLEPADIERVVAIAVAAWEPIYAYYRRAMGEALFAAAYPDWRAVKGGQVRRACAPGSGATVSLAELGGEVIGFVTFYADAASGIGEIGNNAVHPYWQGLGIAQRLYQHAFDNLRARGQRFVKVSTGGDPAHAPARRAYERAGFDIALPTVVYYRAL